MKRSLRFLFLLIFVFFTFHIIVLAAVKKPLHVKGSGSNYHASAAKTSSVSLWLDSVYTWSWDTASVAFQSVPYEKKTDISVDANNNLTGETIQSFNGSAWVNVTRKSYNFINGVYPAGTLGESWNGSAWENASLTTITYNANNYRTSELAQTWNGSAWENSGLSTYTYDVNNNMTSELTQHWSGTSWTNTARHTFVYDVNNNLMSDLYQTWSGSAWSNMNQASYGYDFNNNRTSNVIQVWQSSAWVNYQQYISGYDVNNNLTSDLQQRWNGIAWVNNSMYSVTYDVNENITSTKLEAWIGGWENNRKDTFVYDVYQNLTDYQVHVWDDSIWLNSYLSRMNYDLNNYLVNEWYTYWDSTGTFAEEGDSLAYYYHVPTGTRDLVPSLRVQVYPNPAKDLLMVTDISQNGINEIEMINAEGRKVLGKTYPGTRVLQLDISQLPEGMYMLKVYSEKGILTSKVLKTSQ